MDKEGNEVVVGHNVWYGNNVWVVKELLEGFGGDRRTGFSKLLELAREGSGYTELMYAKSALVINREEYPEYYI